MPYALCVKVAAENGLCLDWLLLGEQPMYRNRVAEQPATYDLDQRHRNLLALFDSLGGEQQQEILAAAQKENRLNRLEQQLSELSKKLG